MSMEKKYYAIFIGSEQDRVLAYAFSIIGFDHVIASDDSEVLKILEKILEESKEKYALILLPERLVESTRNIREKLREEGRIIPAFLFLPGVKKPEFKQLDELEQLLQRALGISLKIVLE